MVEQKPAACNVVAKLRPEWGNMTLQQSPIKGVSTVGSLAGLAAGLVVGSLCQGLAEPVLVGVADAVVASGSHPGCGGAADGGAAPGAVSARGRHRRRRAGQCRRPHGDDGGHPLPCLARRGGTLHRQSDAGPARRYPFDPDAVASLKKTIPQATPGTMPAAAPQQSFLDWLIALVPANPFKAAVNGELLQLMVLTIFFSSR